MPKQYWVVDDVEADLPRVITGSKSTVEQKFDVIAGPFTTAGDAEKAKNEFEERCVQHMEAFADEIARLGLGVDPWGT